MPIGRGDIDVSFEAPERDWSAKLTRPTVNLFLWDIRRSAEHARAGVEQIERDGQQVRRLPLPRVELRYIVTAWTSDHGDERALLAGLLRAILAHDESRRSSCPTDSSAAAVEAHDGQRRLRPPDMSKMLEGQFKPGIHIVVVAAVDTDVVHAGRTAGGDVRDARVADRQRRQRTVRRRAPRRRRDRRPGAIGAVGRSRRVERHVVNESGRFVVAAAPGDTLVIETEPSVTVVVPRCWWGQSGLTCGRKCGPPTYQRSPARWSTIEIDVANTSDVIDGVTARVEGLDPAWVHLPVPVLSLFPDTTGTLPVHVTFPSTTIVGEYLVIVHVESTIDPTAPRAARGVAARRTGRVGVDAAAPERRHQRVDGDDRCDRRQHRQRRDSVHDVGARRDPGVELHGRSADAHRRAGR